MNILHCTYFWPYNIVLLHVTKLHYITSQHITIHITSSRYIISHYITFYFIILYHATLPFSLFLLITYIYNEYITIYFIIMQYLPLNCISAFLLYFRFIILHHYHPILFLLSSFLVSHMFWSLDSQLLFQLLHLIKWI